MAGDIKKLKFGFGFAIKTLDVIIRLFLFIFKKIKYITFYNKHSLFFYKF